MFRLLLALLIALLPMPAAAACHAEQPAAASASHAHHQPAEPEPAKQLPPADQLCIGCIAPTTARPVLGEPAPPARIDMDAREIAGITLGATPPATPPPRLLA